MSVKDVRKVSGKYFPVELTVDDARHYVNSLRNTAIDLWREAGLSGEVLKALVAHANTDVHDRVYGEGLKNMPDVLYKEMSKVSLKSYIE